MGCRELVDGQGSLTCCSPWGVARVRHSLSDCTELMEAELGVSNLHPSILDLALLYPTAPSPLSHFIHLSVAVLGLHCCAPAFSPAVLGGAFLYLQCRLLIAVACLVAEHGPWGAGSSCGSWVWLPRGMESSRPVINSEVPCTGGEFLTTGPSGRSSLPFFSPTHTLQTCPVAYLFCLLSVSAP